MNAKDTRMIRQTADAMRELLPRNRVESGVGHPSSSTRIRISGHDCFHSMGGAGKHLRPIALESWQREIVERHPEDFVRGCLDSDGCRHRRIVRGRNYPAYSFRNRSGDILMLFATACDLAGLRWRRSNRETISIARRHDVARLDGLMAGDETQTPSVVPSSLRKTSTPGA
jgi:hypothetical protein